AVRAHLVAVGGRFGGEPRGRRDRAAAGVDGRLDAVALEQRADARPTGPRAISEMALHAGVRHAVDPLDDFVNVLVALVTARERKFRAFLEIDHDREREPRAGGPAHRRRAVAVAAVVALGWSESEIHVAPFFILRIDPFPKTGSHVSGIM